MMNPDLKSRWIEALESDKYSQGKGCLNDGHGNLCTMGVLYDLSGLGEWVPLAHCDVLTYSLKGHPGPLDCNQFRSLTESMGLSSSAPMVNIPEEMRTKGLFSSHTITFLNDIAGLSFKQIAQVLRANPTL